MPFYVYILASQRNGTLYVGMTNDLARRIYEHKEGLAEGFTKRYGVKTLVHVESYDRAEDAIQREKQLKHWNRPWKVALIEQNNPDWEDLYEQF
ncbi:MAG: GIY-YIG nuclease family protein [Alphaproteobacteria bacterium]|nr:GIY-YIG nuclease family protein [Alphaproteobacteria bacterium]